MNINREIRKAKNDIVYFARNFLGVELTKQHETILTAYDYIRTNPGKNVIVITQRYSDRTLCKRIAEQHKELFINKEEECEH